MQALIPPFASRPKHTSDHRDVTADLLLKDEYEIQRPEGELTNGQHGPRLVILLGETSLYLIGYK